MLLGGMGVGVTGPRIVSAFGEAGGVGNLASVGLGVLYNYSGDLVTVNNDAFRDAIRETRAKSKRPLLVNIMRALTNYEDLARIAVEEKVDGIATGAGPAFDLPGIIKDAPILALPIIRDARTARVTTKRYWRDHKKVPDGFLVEGSLAGGHLAFKYADLVNNTAPTLEELTKGVLGFANNTTSNFDNPIPVYPAGGLYTGADIKEAQTWRAEGEEGAKYKKLGIAGFQIGSRAVTTKECNVHDNFKQEYLRATENDMVIFQSPVGMPGRAVLNEYLNKIIEGEKIDVHCKFHCLHTCDPRTSSHCIAQALVNAHRGNLAEGYAFGGANAWRATPETCLDENGEFITVETLVQKMADEYNAA